MENKLIYIENDVHGSYGDVCLNFFHLVALGF